MRKSSLLTSSIEKTKCRGLGGEDNGDVSPKILLEYKDPRRKRRQKGRKIDLKEKENEETWTRRGELNLK